MNTEDLDLDKLNSKDPKIKYGFVRELLKMGANTPELLYEHFDYWTKMMTSDNNVLKWTAIDIIGYLSAVDKDNKTDKKITDLLNLLQGGHLITCNHAIFALGLIAQNKPQHKTKIIKEFLTVPHLTFDTDDCRDIATGKVLEALKPFLNEIKDNNNVIDFVQKATDTQRNSTRKKAEQILKKIEKLNS